MFLEELTRRNNAKKEWQNIEIIIRKVIKEFKKKEGKKRQRQEERAINWSFIKKKSQNRRNT